MSVWESMVLYVYNNIVKQVWVIWKEFFIQQLVVVGVKCFILKGFSTYKVLKLFYDGNSV